MGKNSEVTWMSRLKEQGDEMDDDSDEKPKESNRTSEWLSRRSNYHLDDQRILPVGSVDPNEVPDRETADRLFGIYLETVHASFPIIGKTAFSNQYELFFSGQARRPGSEWLAILNLIFAIAARYEALTQNSEQEVTQDHLVFFARARVLSLGDEVIFGHASIQQLQVFGLASFYFLASDQISR